jgi:parvulin-like peptidyl-prolyl isomerase
MMKRLATRVSILSIVVLAALAVAQVTTVMTVNDRPVLSTELERLKTQNQLFTKPAKGFVKTDLQNLLVNQLILVTAARQDASNAEVSEDKVNQFIIDLRNQRGIKTDEEYTSFLQSLGYDQVDFRQAVIEQLELTTRVEEIQKSEDVSDDEVELYFDLYKNNYLLPASIQARQIVLATLKEAQQILKRIKTGENFATLARAKSILGSKQDGAIAAKPGETTPQSITELALPKELADAAFGLKKAGVTEIVTFDNRFYIIKVEKFNAERVPSFQEAITTLEPDGKTNKLHEDAQAVKGNGLIENWVSDLQRDAIINIPEGSSLEFYDPLVARVEGTDILLSELNRAVYGNQQIEQFLSQTDGSTMLRDFFKPQSLNTLIDQAVALEVARKLDLPFIGARADVFESVKRHQTQGVKVTESEAKAYYQNNLIRFTMPAKADLTTITFRNQKTAEQFRVALQKPRETLLKIAARFKGTLNDLGTTEENAVVYPNAQKAIFQTKLSVSTLGSYTTVIKIDSNYLVYVVKNFKPQQRQPFNDVKTVATAQALADKQGQAGEKAIKEARKTLKLENFLDAVTAESETLGNRKP